MPFLALSYITLRSHHLVFLYRNIINGYMAPNFTQDGSSFTLPVPKLQKGEAPELTEAQKAEEILFTKMHFDSTTQGGHQYDDIDW